MQKSKSPVASLDIKIQANTKLQAAQSTFLGLGAAARAGRGWPSFCLGGGVCPDLGLGAGVSFRRKVWDGRVVWSQEVFPQRFVPILDGLRVCLQGQSCNVKERGERKFDKCTFLMFINMKLTWAAFRCRDSQHYCTGETSTKSFPSTSTGTTPSCEPVKPSAASLTQHFSVIRK